MDLVEQLKEAHRVGRQYRADNRIDVHPNSYDDFATYFERKYVEDIGSLGMIIGIPVYKKGYVPEGKAVFTTKHDMVVIDLS